MLGKKNVTIFIGEYYVSSKPVVISTLLGSCVAACLFDPVKKIGGMNHIQMPGKADFNNFNTAARYSINAMELIINGMLKLGSDKKNIIAKLFGGASVIPGVTFNRAVGDEIKDFVTTFLKKENIPITGSDLGGIKTRKVFFHSDTGDAFVKLSRSMNSSHILAEEERRLKLLKAELSHEPDTTLF